MIGVGSGGALLTALALASLVAPSAAAAPRTIAGWGHGAGRVNNAEGVAVDNSCARHEPPLDETTTPTCSEFDPFDRDVYVADRGNFRIDRFGPEGDFQLAWGAGVADGKGPGLQVCGPAAEPPAKRCFEGLGSGGSEEPIAPSPRAVAIEAATGAVYVAEAVRRVSRFTPAGRFVCMFGKEVDKTKVEEREKQEEDSEPITVTAEEEDICTAASGDACGKGKAGTGPGEFESPLSLAFDGEGGLWVNDKGERAQRFDAGGGFLEEVPLPSSTQNSALAINPTGGDLYALGPQGHNEGQTISLNSNFSEPAGGSEFTLSFEGEVAGSFPYLEWNAIREEREELAEAIQPALEALPTIGKGNVSVKLLASDYSVTFIHELGGRDVPELSATTRGEAPPVTVTTGTQGGPGSVRRLNSTGAPKDELDNSPGDLPQTLATDAAGDLYVGDAGVPYHLLRYDAAGNLTSLFAAGQVLGSPEGNAIALDEAGKSLYTASSRSASGPGPAAEQVAVQRFELPAPGPLPSEAHAEGVLPTEATLAATLNPEGHETTYRFQYLTEAAFEGQGDSFEGPATEETPIETLEEGGAPYEGFDGKPVSAPLKDLVPATAYRFRILAANSEGKTEAGGAFATRTAVGIEAQWASALSAHEATLNARLDPFGAEARWWLEYDTAPYAEGEPPHGASVPLPHPGLPASFGEVPVVVALRGLAASTTYHYRFAAHDEREVREGGETVTRPFTTYAPGQSFTTQPAGLGFALPDGRAWEMVSPPDKHGGRIAGFDQTGGQVQAAANGEALAYLSYGSLEADPEGNRIIEQSSELARRGAGSAWRSVDITPPHTEAAPIKTNAGLEYKLFSTNLERALLDPHAPVEISPYASEPTPYLREDSQPPAYTPLAVGCPPEGEPCPAAVREHENVPAGTEFGGELQVRGASPDLRHVVLLSKAPLAEGAAERSLYEWSGGALRPLSVLPADEGGEVVAADLGAGETSTRGAVSGVGSRVFWSEGPSLPFAGLYLRDTVRGETIRLDKEQEGAFGTGKVDPRFQGASADGAVAFFTDTQNLTEDANEEGADLYRWRARGTHGCEEVSGCLEDLSAAVVDFGESAEVLGVLPGIAEDGSRAFFVARGVLDAEPNAYGESATHGQHNLYAWQEGEGVRFLATLSGEDSHDWDSAWSLTAAASPSGRYLAFMSALPLTGYDNRALGGGERAQEVFRYDAAADELACVSCNPSGARPRAWAEGSERRSEEEALDPQQLWGEAARGWLHAVAALVPEAPKLEGLGGFVSAYRPRYVQDDGRVVFDARDSLVAADSNGAADVYEFEPAGTGCAAVAAGSGTAAVPGGCVSLISSGAAEGTSAFLDASEGARDVFFYSPARLSATDVDDQLDVYDAREGGEPATLEPVAECLGEACQPPATPPPYTTGATATHHGPGNVREKSDGAGRCAKPAREAKRLARRARGLRRRERIARHGTGSARARHMILRARRLATRAKRQSRQAKRCRRRAARRRSR
jgi:hypothetical protein